MKNEPPGTALLVLICIYIYVLHFLRRFLRFLFYFIVFYFFGKTQDVEFAVQEASTIVRPGCVAAFSTTELGGELEVRLALIL